VVAQPLRRAETLVLYSGSCVAPLRLGGLRGKQSTPSVWLGGTGELSAVGKRERQGERTWHGARDVAHFFLPPARHLGVLPALRPW
jgi:hypothetical protein